MYHQGKHEIIALNDKGRVNGHVGCDHGKYGESTDHRESLEKFLAKKVSNMEEDFKSVLLEYFNEVDRERAYLIEETNALRDERHNKEEGQLNKHRNDGERGKLIKRLTSNGKVLVQEIERLKKDVTRFKEKENNLVKDNNRMGREIGFKQKEIEELEHDLKILRDENSYLKMLAQDSGKLKEREDEIANLESQVLFQQKMCKEYSLELADKDDKINKFKQRCNEFEMDLGHRLKENEMRHKENQRNSDRELDAAKKLNAELENKCEAAAREIEVTQEMLESGKREIRELRKELDLYKQRESTVERKCAKDQEKKKKMESEIRAMHDNNIMLQRQVDALDKDLAVKRMKMDTCLYENEIMQKDLKSCESKLKELRLVKEESVIAERKSREELLVCKTKLSHYENENSNFSKTMKQLEEEVYTLQDKTVQLQTECDSKEVRDNEMQREILSYVKQCSQHEQDLHIANKKFENVKEQLDQCETQNNALHREVKEFQEKTTALEIVIEAGKEEETRSQRQIIAAQKRYAKLEKELTALHRELDNSNRDKESLFDKYQHVQATYDEHQQENLRLKENLKGRSEICEELEERCKKYQREIKEIEVQQEQLERNLRNSNSDLEHTRSELEYKEKDNKKLKQMLTKVEEELRDVQHEALCLKREGGSDQQRLEMLRAENKELRYKTDELRSESEKSKIELASLQDECNTLQRAHLKLEAANKAFSDRNEALESEAEDVRKQMLDVRFRNNEIEEKKNKWKTEIEIAQKNIGLLEEKCSELTQIKNDLELKAAENFREQMTYEENREDFIRTKESLNRRIKELEAEIAALRKHVKETEDEVWSLKRDRSSNEDYKMRAEEETLKWKQKCEQYEDRVQKLQEELRGLQDRCWEHERIKFTIAGEKDAKSNEILKLNEQKKQLERNLVFFQEKEEKILSDKQQAVMELKEHKEKLQTMNEANKEGARSLENVKSQLRGLEKEISELKEKQREDEKETVSLQDELRKEKSNKLKLEDDIETLHLEKKSMSQEIEKLSFEVMELQALSSGKMKESGQMAVDLMKAERRVSTLESQCKRLEDEEKEKEIERQMLREEMKNVKQIEMKQSTENQKIQQTLKDYEKKIEVSEKRTKEEAKKAEELENQLQSLKRETLSMKEKLVEEKMQIVDQLEILKGKDIKHGTEYETLKLELHQCELQLAATEERCHISEIKLHDTSKSRASIEGKLTEAQGMIEIQREKINELNDKMDAVTVDAELTLKEAEGIRKEYNTLKEEQLKLTADKVSSEQQMSELLHENEESRRGIERKDMALKRKEEDLFKLKQDYENLKRQQEQDEQELATAKKRLSAMEREYRCLGDEKDKLEKQIELAEVEYEDLHKEMEDRDKENAKLKESINTLKQLKEDVDMLWENEKNLRVGEREQLESEIEELKKKIAELDGEVGKMNFELEDNEDKTKEMSQETERYLKMLQDANREKEEERSKHNEELQRMEEQMQLIEESGKMQLNEMREMLRAAEDAKNQYASNYAWKMEQNDDEKIKLLEQQINDLKNKFNETKSRAEKSDAEIFRLKTQLDWIEEDRKETENAKRALQDDFNKCLGELDQTRGEIMEIQVEKEQLKQEVVRQQEELMRKSDMRAHEESDQLARALEDSRRNAVEISKLKEHNQDLKKELDNLTREKDRLEAHINRGEDLTRHVLNDVEDAKRQKQEKELLTSQLEAVARERRQLDRLLAEKEEARSRLENENESLRRAMEKSKVPGKTSAHVTSAALHDEKAALKNELSEVYMKHQRDLDRIDKLKAENSKLSREIDQLRRELQSKNQELELLRKQTRNKSGPGTKKEVSSIYIQPEQESISFTVTPKTAPLKASDARGSSQPEVERDTDDIGLQSISRNPFLTRDKARSKSMDELDVEKQRRNPFTTPTQTAPVIHKEADTQVKLVQPQSDQQAFSLLSDDLRASTDNLDTIGTSEEHSKTKEKLPSKDFVNKLRANFEGASDGRGDGGNKKLGQQQQSKVDLFS